MRLEDMKARMEAVAERSARYGTHASFMLDVLAQGAMQDTPEDWRYQSYQDLVADLSDGPKCVSPGLSVGYSPMEPQQCFRNAWELVLDNTDLLYCEGWAMAHVFPTPHAWVETRGGQVIDPTWVFDDLETIHYLGVRFNAEVLMTLCMETGWASVFGGDGRELNNRALRYGFEMEDGIVIGAIREKESAHD